MNSNPINQMALDIQPNSAAKDLQQTTFSLFLDIPRKKLCMQQQIQKLLVHALNAMFFVLKMLSAFQACCIYSSALQTRFYHGSNQYEPRSDCSIGSSLIWVHIVYNRLPKNIYCYNAYQRADGKSCDWPIGWVEYAELW